MKILFAGDFCDIGRTSQCIKENNFETLFSEVKDITNSNDYNVVNFEFPIVVDKGEPIKKCGPHLSGQKNSIQAIKYAGFNVCTLANNHILDQGEKCCLNTKRSIESEGIKTVGVGRDIEEANRILYLTKCDERVAIINCCEHEFSIAGSLTAGANPLNPIKQYYAIKEAKTQADYVVLIIHGGHEMYQLPSPRMKQLYRFFIDAGANVVVNHHQHCYSGYEKYNRGLIFYGLGNFLFDKNLGRNNNDWYEGVMVIVNLHKDSFEFSLIPYIQSKDKIGVHILKDKSFFDKKINYLNSIIQDDVQLLANYNSFLDKIENGYKAIFVPYTNRYLIALSNRGLLPSFLSERKQSRIYGYLNCESHLDALKNAITKLVKN